MEPRIIACLLIYILDIGVRLRTGITNDHKFTTDSKKVFNDYLEKWILIDIIATFPFEYFLTGSDNTITCRWFMLVRLLKLGRLVETA